MKSAGVVFDCMVFVQIVASRGTAFRCYEQVVRYRSPLLVSAETLSELRAVLERPELQRKLPGITPERVNALMRHLADLAVHVNPVPIRFEFPPDPKDEPYVNLAIAGRAGNLLTRDKALLRLSNPADPLFWGLVSLNPGLQILLPEQFLRPD